MRKAALAVAALAILLGGLAAALPLLERHAASQLKAAIESDGRSAVGAVEVSLLERRVVLDKLKLGGPGVTGSVARLDAVGLAWPLGELLRGRTPFAGWTWGDPLRARHVGVQGLDLADGSGARWSARTLTVEGLDLARFDGAYAGRHPIPVLSARALAALTVSHVEGDTALVALPGTADTIGAARLVAEGYAQGRLAALDLDAIEATAREATAPQLSVAHGKVRGVDAAPVLARLSRADWAPGRPLGRLAALEAFALNEFGGELLAQWGVSLAAITLEAKPEGAEIMRSRFGVAGFVLGPPRGLQGLQMRMMLGAVGLKEIKLDLDCAATEERQLNRAEFGPCVLVGPGLGKVEWSLGVVDGDPPFWRAVDGGDLAGIEQSTVALGSARVVVADSGLLERGLKALSMLNGKGADETRRLMAQEIRAYQPPGILISRDLSSLLDAVARFVERGGVLTVQARPEPPAGLAALEGLLRPGADLVGVLGLTASLAPRERPKP